MAFKDDKIAQIGGADPPSIIVSHKAGKCALFVPHLRRKSEQLDKPENWKIVSSATCMKAAVILNLKEEFELVLVDCFGKRSWVNLKERLAKAHGNYLESSTRGSEIIDCHWVEQTEEVRNSSLSLAKQETRPVLIVTFTNGNVACFSGIDGSVIKIGTESTCGQSIIANRKYFF